MKKITKLQKLDIQTRVNDGIEFLRKLANKRKKIKNAILKIRTSKLDIQRNIASQTICGCVLSELAFHYSGDNISSFQDGCEIVKISNSDNIGNLGFDFKNPDDENQFSSYSVLTKPWKLELSKLQKKLKS